MFLLIGAYSRAQPPDILNRTQQPPQHFSTNVLYQHLVNRIHIPKYLRSENLNVSDKLEEPPIKLVLKVGSSEKAPQETKVRERDVPADAQRPKEHSTKRKKKKRSSSKDRKKRKHVDGVEDQVSLMV